jgi:hypothetical protein
VAPYLTLTKTKSSQTATSLIKGGRTNIFNGAPHNVFVANLCRLYPKVASSPFPQSKKSEQLHAVSKVLDTACNDTIAKPSISSS